MKPHPRFSNPFALISGTLIALISAGSPAAFSQTAPAADPPVRLAQGPWRQTAAIETFSDPGGPYPAMPTGPRPRPANVNAIAWLDNDRLAIADGKHPIRVVSAATGELLESFGEPTVSGTMDRRIVPSPNGQYLLLVSSSAPGVWNTRTGKLVDILPALDKAGYEAAVFVTDSRLAVLRSTALEHTMRKELCTFDIDSDKRLVLLQQSPVSINAQKLMATGGYIAVDGGGAFQVFAADSLNCVLQPPKSQYYLLDFQERGKPISLLALDVIGGSHWNESKPELKRYTFPGGEVTALENFTFDERGSNDHRFQAVFSVSPDGMMLVATREGRADFYDLSRGDLFQSITLGNPLHHPLVQILSADRALLRTQMHEGTFEYDLATGKKLATIPENDTPIPSPNGQRIALCRTSTTLEVDRYRELPTPLVTVWQRNK